MSGLPWVREARERGQSRVAEVYRCFIAVPLPPAFREAVAGLQRQVRDACDTVMGRADMLRWVRPDDMHMTVRFLGDTPTRKMAPLGDLLEQSAARARCVDLSATGVDAFPSAARPRVLLLRMSDPTDVLSSLAKEIERGVRRLGFTREERPFTPHVTLARARRDSRLPSLEGIVSGQEVAGLGPLRVEALVLYRSELAPGGPRYTALATHSLPRERVAPA